MTAEATYLRVTPLIRKVSRVYQDIALRQLDRGIVGVANANNSGPRSPNHFRHVFSWWNADDLIY